MVRQRPPEPHGTVRPRETTETTPKAKARVSQIAAHLDPLQASMQAVISFIAKPGKQIEVETNELIRELSWDDPILTKA
eukprot:9383327-Lingulodinium_polyedra.AAC.1